MRLPGVGPTTAKKIIAGRPYASVDELSKAGLSASVIKKITPLVTVAGGTAAPPSTKKSAKEGIPISQPSPTTPSQPTPTPPAKATPSAIYLARYTHRVAISNHRILNVADGKVTFRWKDYARGSKQRTMVLRSDEFLRRFLLHVLPRGLVRIRFFGFLANRRRKQLLPLCRRLLEVSPLPSLPALRAGEAKQPVTWLCPNCGGAMVLVERFSAEQIHGESVPVSDCFDSS
jgi:hypothetical protein